VTSPADVSTTSRLIILNTVALAAVTFMAMHGYVQTVFAGDKSMASFAIAATVAVGLVAAFFTGKHLMRAAWLCEVLGFTGTLVGITMGLAGGADLATTDGIIAAGASLFNGMATAFYSTLVGVAGMLWLWAAAQVRGVPAVDDDHWRHD
jgi:hypothetical protein